MAYARDSKSRSLTGLRVRLPSPAPFQNGMTPRRLFLKYLYNNNKNIREMSKMKFFTTLIRIKSRGVRALQTLTVLKTAEIQLFLCA